MKAIFVKIPDENVDLATQLLEKPGAEIEEKKRFKKNPLIKKLMQPKK